MWHMNVASDGELDVRLDGRSCDSQMFYHIMPSLVVLCACQAFMGQLRACCLAWGVLITPRGHARKSGRT